MGRAVLADQPSPVKAQHYRQFLQSNVVDDLVIRTLRKRRINVADRPQTPAGEPRTEGHRVLLLYAHVEETLRETLRKFCHPASGRHCRRNAHHAAVHLRKVA